MMIKKLTILTLLMALLACPDVAMAKKKKDNKRQQPQPQQEIRFEPQVKVVDYPIENPMAQLNGEWNLVQIDGDDVNLPRSMRAYLYFDVEAGMLYGNTGTNTLNATYKLDGNKFKVDNVVTTKIDGDYYQRLENRMLNCLNEANTISLLSEGDVEYMLVKHNRDELMKFRRQNLDFINGVWRVMRINETDIPRECDIKIVNDVDMKTVNIISGNNINIINGVMYIDPMIVHGIEFEDLEFRPTRYRWKYFDTETRLLIALEETLYCRKAISGNQIELYTKTLNNRGQFDDKVLVVLQRFDPRY